MGRTRNTIAQMDPAALAQMQAQAPKSQEEAAAQQEKHQEMEDKRKTILNQIFTAEAQDRLGRIAVVKASFARQVEDTLIQQAMAGKLQGQLDDKGLLALLEKFNASNGGGSGPKVQLQRRNIMDDDDW